MQVLDLSVTIILFIVGCFLGKCIMNYHDTWFAFNGPALAVLVIGEMVWWGVKKILCGRTKQMAVIHELATKDSDYIKEIADLHKRAFPSFFLTQLGVPFLKTLYSGYMEDKDSGIIVAEEKEKLIGFLAYSNDYSRFYKGLIKNHLMKFAFCSIGAAIRHPSFIKRLLGAFKKSESVVKTERYVELASICVDPEIESKGVGSALINYLKAIVDYDKFAYINLETDADGNESVNKFYVKNGFKLEREYVTAEGRRMNEYRFAPGEKR